jgi:hypothetical protein
VHRFSQIKDILDNAVGGQGAQVGGPHGPFWRALTRDQFVNFAVFGNPLVTLGDGDGSNIVKALRGQQPFGADVGTPGASFRRMPAGRPPVPADQIAVIATWIDDGCPEESEDPVGTLEVLLEGAGSGDGFVIVSSAEHPLPATLTLRTTDGSQGEVTCRQGQGSGATLAISPAVVHVSAEPVQVQVQATSPSAAQNDAVIEVVQADRVVATFQLTAIQAPLVRFRGRFQCRLATDPDPFDHPWGEQSSFGVYAVQGPDPADPDEPPLDRIVRFHDAVAPRPFCPAVGVAVDAVEAQVGGQTVTFTTGDALLGQSVRLGPNCKFDGRNRTFAPDGFEPISDFRLEIGSAFSGAAAPAVARPSSDDPPGSTAPYADGIFVLDVDPTPWPPGEFGYQEATWAEHAWAVVATKLARLVVQQPADAKAARLRDRRLKEHGPGRLPAIGIPFRLMERYTGLVDRELSFGPEPAGALAYLAGLASIQVSAEFFDFDTDCQVGTVNGTLGAPVPEAPPPEGVVIHSPQRRTAPLDE